MNDLDVLADRLHQLARTAPVPAVDPPSDIRRGRVALRRRRARTTAGVTTTLMAVGVIGAVVAAAPHLPLGADGGTDTTVAPAAVPSVASPSPTAVPATTSINDLCGPPVGSSITADGSSTTVSGPAGVATAVGSAGSSLLLGGAVRGERPWKNPLVAPTLAAYRQAAVAVLDPSGAHLPRKVSGIQAGCTNVDGAVEFSELGTKLGWRSGKALGVVQIDVSSPTNDQEPQVVINHHGRWTAYTGTLPAGVTEARIAHDDGSLAVVATRTDGLTVAIDADGVWGNNAAPGSPAARDLPGSAALLTLAASPRLTLPED